MTGIMCALAGSASRIYLGTATVTVGFLSSGGFSSYGKGAAQGSITPATWAASGLTVEELKDVYSSSVFSFLIFMVIGSAPNSGWSTLTIGGTPLNRTAATYTNNGTNTQWVWYPGGGGSALFGTTIGATRSIIWS